MPSSERKLHIGGVYKVDGWEVFNAIPADYVEHVGDAKDLSRFLDETFSEIYASHILEHFDHKDEIYTVLKEWHRVLKKGGKLYISVPNLDVLARLLLLDYLTIDERFDIMTTIFGGHTTPYDYHKIGFNKDFLLRYLQQTGFNNFVIKDKFGMFIDCSQNEYHGALISLNVIAQKV